MSVRPNLIWISFNRWAKRGLFLFISFFSHDKYSTNLNINDKSIDYMLWIWTWGGRKVGVEESTELWRHSNSKKNSFCKKGHSRRTGIKPRTSNVGSDRSTNWATTTAHEFIVNIFLIYPQPSWPINLFLSVRSISGNSPSREKNSWKLTCDTFFDDVSKNKKERKW